MCSTWAASRDARPTGTVDHHVNVGLRQLASRLEFQKAPRNSDGTLNIARTHFIFLPHVEQDQLVTVRAACCHLFDTDLRNRPAGFSEEIVRGV